MLLLALTAATYWMAATKQRLDQLSFEQALRMVRYGDRDQQRAAAIMLSGYCLDAVGALRDLEDVDPDHGAEHMRRLRDAAARRR